VTYAGNAVAMTLPIAGSATGTGFTFRRWVQRGADPAVATWSLLMAGIFSGASLAIVGGIGGLLAGNVATGVLGAISTLFGIAPFVIVLVAVRRPRWRRVVVVVSTAVVARILAVRRRDNSDAEADVERFLDQLAAVHMGGKAGLEAAGFALMNWVADVGCLAACLAAFRVSIPWSHLLLLYMAGIGAATFNLTPAGIGVVEVALAAAATSFGIARRDAMASALLYRGVSSWLIIAAGWVVFAALRRRSKHLAPAGGLETSFEDESLDDESLDDESLDDDEESGLAIVVPAFGASRPISVGAAGAGAATADVRDGSLAVACSGISTPP
jgi:hypothetical protein